MRLKKIVGITISFILVKSQDTTGFEKEKNCIMREKPTVQPWNQGSRQDFGMSSRHMMKQSQIIAWEKILVLYVWNQVINSSSAYSQEGGTSCDKTSSLNQGIQLRGEGVALDSRKSNISCYVSIKCCKTTVVPKLKAIFF